MRLLAFLDRIIENDGEAKGPGSPVLEIDQPLERVKTSSTDRLESGYSLVIAWTCPKLPANQCIPIGEQ
jgi:hypothetical protein